MNRSKLFWGILCLVIAGGLALATLTLPSENLMFIIGDVNAPWVPTAGFAIVGLVLLLGASERAEEKPAAPQFVRDPARAALNKRFENIAWGLFLIAFGGFMLVPHDVAAKGIWSICVGFIMLGLNAARYYYKIRMSGFTTFLAILSVLGGIAVMLGLSSLEGAFLLIILGAYLILKPWFDQHQLFGKAEHSKL